MRQMMVVACPYMYMRVCVRVATNLFGALATNTTHSRLSNAVSLQEVHTYIDMNERTYARMHAYSHLPQCRSLHFY